MNFEPTDNDVFFARGNGANNKEGNRRYRIVIRTHKRRYQSARFNREKAAIAQNVKNMIIQCGGTFNSQSGDLVGTTFVETCRWALREKKKNRADETSLSQPQLSLWSANAAADTAAADADCSVPPKDDISASFPTIRITTKMETSPVLKRLGRLSDESCYYWSWNCSFATINTKYFSLPSFFVFVCYCS